jgi:protein disulfide-isomerase
MIRKVQRIALTLCSALVLTASFAMAAEDGWLTDFAQAKKVAAEKKLPILIDFTGSDWCGWCIKLDREVFSQKAFKDYAKDNLVLFKADFPRHKPQTDEVRKQNRKLAAEYALRGYPTIILVAADGTEIARTGYQRGGAEKYVEHLKKMLKDAVKNTGKEKKD